MRAVVTACGSETGGASATTGFLSRRLLRFCEGGGLKSRILNVGWCVSDAGAVCMTGFAGSGAGAATGTGIGFLRSMLSAMRGGIGAARALRGIVASGWRSHSVPPTTPPASMQTTAV